MRIVEIEKLNNGGHRNQTANHLIAIPDGWAIIPDNLVCENFPFGDVVAVEVKGVMTVVEWIPGDIPEPDPEPEVQYEPDTAELLDVLLGVSE